MIEYLAFISRVVLVLVLGAAVLGKLSHQKQFMANLQESFSIPQPLVLPGFILLVVVEAALALGLIINTNLLNVTFAVVALMFAVMTTTLLVMLLQDRVFKCACFGEPQNNANFGDVLRNGILILAALSGVLADNIIVTAQEQLLSVLVALPVAYVLIHFSELYPVITYHEKRR